MRAFTTVGLLVVAIAVGSARETVAQSAIVTDGAIESTSGGFVFPDGSVMKSAPGEEFLRVAGSNFVPRDSTTTYSYSGGGCTQRNSSTGDSWFTYDVQIPDGAVIDFLRLYYFDSDTAFDVNSELWAFDGAGGVSLIAEADSTGSPGYSSAGSNFFSHVVDSLNQSLVVVVSIPTGAGSQLRNCGVRLRYQAPGSLEAVRQRTAGSDARSWPLDPTAPDNGESDGSLVDE
jgi:hypothetical protein